MSQQPVFHPYLLRDVYSAAGAPLPFTRKVGRRAPNATKSSGSLSLQIGAIIALASCTHHREGSLCPSARPCNNCTLTHKVPRHLQVPGLASTLDYVWASSQLAVTRVLHPLTRRDLNQPCFPNPDNPSDHIPLGAVLRVMPAL